MHEFILRTSVRTQFVLCLHFRSFKFIYGPNQSTVFLHEEEKVSQCLLTCNSLFEEAANASTSFNFSYKLGRTPWTIIFFFLIFGYCEYIRYKFIPDSYLGRWSSSTRQKLNNWIPDVDLNVQNIAANIFCKYMSCYGLYECDYVLYICFIYIFIYAEFLNVDRHAWTRPTQMRVLTGWPQMPICFSFHYKSQ